MRCASQNRFVDAIEWLRQVDVLGEHRQQRDRRVAVGFETGGELEGVSGNKDLPGDFGASVARWLRRRQTNRNIGLRAMAKYGRLVG